MKFNEGARLDTTQVQDRRGSGGGGSSGPVAVASAGCGGGSAAARASAAAIGLLVVVAFVLIQMFSGGGRRADSGSTSRARRASQGSGTADNAQLAQACQTGADANTRDDCAVVAVINSVQGYWTDALRRRRDDLPGSRHRLLQRADRHRVRQRHRRAWGRSTARPTRSSTST